MTKDSNKELTAEQKVGNILAEFLAEDKAYELGHQFLEDYDKYALRHIMQLIRSECKRFALECVPERIIKTNTVQTYFEDGHNICREQMIKNIEEKSK